MGTNCKPIAVPPVFEFLTGDRGFRISFGKLPFAPVYTIHGKENGVRLS